MAVPKLRFPEFTDDWEQRKFGDVFEEYSEKNHEDLPPLTIVQGSGTIPREESGRDIKYDKSSLNNYKLVNPGDFILHLRSFEGGLEVANSQGIVSPAYHIFRGIRTDSRFYYPFFRSHDFINILLKPHVYGIRDGKSIDVEGMKSIKIPYPDFDEQKRVGDFFYHLDNAITLHQRKLEDLRILKKSMLQKMFPSEGNSVPEVRFPEFTAAWEQRKLGDLGSLKNGMNFSKDAMGHGYAFVNLQNIFGNNVVEAKSLGLAEASEKQLLEYSLQKGDVLFVRSSVKLEGVGEVALVAENLENTTYSGFIIRFRDGYGLNNDFKKFVFATKKVRDQIMSQATNSANKNISQSVLENLTFEIPSKDEQKQIGEFFSNLDNLITLHQRKCDDLQKLKKALLQQMFC